MAGVGETDSQRLWGWGHVPEKSPDGTGPTCWEERKLLQVEGGGPPPALAGRPRPHPTPTWACAGGRRQLAGLDGRRRSRHRATGADRKQKRPEPADSSPGPVAPPGQGGFLDSPGASGTLRTVGKQPGSPNGTSYSPPYLVQDPQPTPLRGLEQCPCGASLSITLTPLGCAPQHAHHGPGRELSQGHLHPPRGQIHSRLEPHGSFQRSAAPLTGACPGQGDFRSVWTETAGTHVDSQRLPSRCN